MANGDSFVKAAERDGAPIRRLPDRRSGLQMGEARKTPQFYEHSDTFPPPPELREDGTPERRRRLSRPGYRGH